MQAENATVYSADVLSQNSHTSYGEGGGEHVVVEDDGHLRLSRQVSEDGKDTWLSGLMLICVGDTSRKPLPSGTRT